MREEGAHGGCGVGVGYPPPHPHRLPHGAQAWLFTDFTGAEHCEPPPTPNTTERTRTQSSEPTLTPLTQEHSHHTHTDAQRSTCPCLLCAALEGTPPSAGPQTCALSPHPERMAVELASLILTMSYQLLLQRR